MIETLVEYLITVGFLLNSLSNSKSANILSEQSGSFSRVLSPLQCKTQDSHYRELDVLKLLSNCDAPCTTPVKAAVP